MVSGKKIISLMLIVVFCFSVLAVAPKPAYAYGMDAVFKDMGFGLLIGTIMAGLIMATNPNTRSDDWGRGLAIGGAAGATLGLGIGMASTYKTALLNVDKKGNFALGFPAIETAVAARKTSVSVLQLRF